VALPRKRRRKTDINSPRTSAVKPKGSVTLPDKSSESVVVADVNQLNVEHVNADQPKTQQCSRVTAGESNEEAD